MARRARAAALCLALSAAAAAEGERGLLLNLVHGNPGDPLGVQQSRFQDAGWLKGLGYDGDVATGEYAATLMSDFSSVGLDIWPAGSPARAWREAMLPNLRQWVAERKAAGLQAIFWLDMAVFPISLLQHYGEEVLSDGAVDYRKKRTKALLRAQLREAMALFPDADGFVVRTGETYVFDTPYHRGNSPVLPSFQEQNEIWADFLNLLREEVAVRGNRRVYFRTWDNFDGWRSSAAAYRAVMGRVEPHANFWVSVKQQAGDYFRFAEFTPQAGVGPHPQVVELSAQRSWEGKGAYPNYVADIVIDGYPELPAEKRFGLSRFVRVNASSVLKGAWVWARGDGWWGPYLKGQELWPLLTAKVLAAYWRGGGDVTEEQAFSRACGESCGLGEKACRALRRAGQMGAEAVLKMRYCPEIAKVGSACWHWYRDDRVGGFGQLKAELPEILRSEELTERALANRARALELMSGARDLIAREVAPHAPDAALRRFLLAHGEYGVRHFAVMECGWRVMLRGLQYKAARTAATLALAQRAVADYDAAWAAHLTLRLLPGAPSEMRDIFFAEPGKEAPPGMGASVETVRKLLAEPDLAELFA